MLCSIIALDPCFWMQAVCFKMSSRLSPQHRSIVGRRPCGWRSLAQLSLKLYLQNKSLSGPRLLGQDWWERFSSLVEFWLLDSGRCSCMLHLHQKAVIVLQSGMTRDFLALPNSAGHSWIPLQAAGNKTRINHSCCDLGQSNARAGQTPAQGSGMHPCPLPGVIWATLLLYFALSFRKLVGLLSPGLK